MVSNQLKAGTRKEGALRVQGPFEVAAGSVTGRSHVLGGKPNQDAFAFRAADHGLVGVVCDGCGSGAHNEVGAAGGFLG